ncbi:MAG TPA: DUF4412 domain-containing protein [Gemmatimonadaceae bacterium]|nr:DUF4412 domain-containing protein [Gemmatimonadaceae bacterium]
MLGLAPAAGAQNAFEGVVTYKMNSDKGTLMTTMTYTAKGNKVFWQSADANDPSKSAGIILDGDAHTMTMIIPQQQMYIVQPFNEKMAVPDSMRSGSWKLNKIGSETVAGVSCDDYQVVDPQGKPDEKICAAHGLGNFTMGGTMDKSARNQWASHLSGMTSAMAGGFFPLKAVRADGSTEMEAVKVEKSSVSDATFAPPAGYKAMSVPAGARH